VGCGPTTGRGGSCDRRAEPRASVLGHARRGFTEFARKGAQTYTKLTGVHRGVEISREETGAPARLESMFRIAVALIFLVALVGATADLARGRRPILFA
jgi:hypothetical protein